MNRIACLVAVFALVDPARGDIREGCSLAGEGAALTGGQFTLAKSALENGSSPVPRFVLRLTRGKGAGRREVWRVRSDADHDLLWIANDGSVVATGGIPCARGHAALTVRDARGRVLYDLRAEQITSLWEQVQPGFALQVMDVDLGAKTLTLGMSARELQPRVMDLGAGRVAENPIARPPVLYPRHACPADSRSFAHGRYGRAIFDCIRAGSREGPHAEWVFEHGRFALVESGFFDRDLESGRWWYRGGEPGIVIRRADEPTPQVERGPCEAWFEGGRRIHGRCAPALRPSVPDTP